MKSLKLNLSQTRRMSAIAVGYATHVPSPDDAYLAECGLIKRDGARWLLTEFGIETLTPPIDARLIFPNG